MKNAKKRVVALLSAWLLLLSGSVLADTPSLSNNNDPYETMNRSIFAFNDKVDRAVVKPVAQSYARIIPLPVRHLVTNFFNNLGEPRNLINDILQWKWRRAGVASSRFVINSTLGMLGTMDVASSWGITDSDNDFGLTLAHWGVPGGSYLVIPFAGPSTIRSAIGLYPDDLAWPVHYIEDSKANLATLLVWGVNLRAGLLKQEELIVGDRYTFIRDAYLQNRAYKITGEMPADDF